MPTKAELERQVKSLKLQLANALAETRGTRDEEAEVTELRQCNEHLCSQLNKLQTQLERERSARQEAESALLEKQHLVAPLQQERSIGMLQRPMHTLSISTPDVSVGQSNDPPPSGDR